MALTNKLTNIANAIREKTGSTELLTLDAMPTAISSITTGEGGGLPDGALTITGDHDYMFYKDNWSWFFNAYKDKITTSDISSMASMFRNTNQIEEIPFDLNLKANTNVDAIYLFSNCSRLIKPPYIKGKLGSVNNFFDNCIRLVDIPEDWASYIDWSHINSYNYAGIQSFFSGCQGLKSIPQSLLNNLWSTGTSGTYVVYNYMFNNCYALSGPIKVGIQKAALTANRCGSMVNNCHRLSNLTFATQADGTPEVATWKTQTLDFSVSVGYGTVNNITGYSGITADKEVIDDATYKALKNDPDWFTTKVEYSRYNLASAIETLNSLPDTSAYGTNTIKFKRGAGSATDGGGITDEGIAAAAASASARGWTVSLV